MIMTLRYGTLCLVALVAVVLLAFENYETWTASPEAVSQKVVSKKAPAKTKESQFAADQKDSRSNPGTAPAVASYIFISEKNPFHPARKEFPIPEVPKVEVKKPIVRPQVTLYGVTLAGNYQSATISYPGRTLQKGERETLTVRLGDQVGEYKVNQIFQDRIALKAEEDSFEVRLYDSGAPKKRSAVKTENKPASVVSTASGSGGTSPEGARPAPGMPPASDASKTTPAQAGATPPPASPPPGARPPATVQTPAVTPPAATPAPAGGAVPNPRTRRFQPTTPSGQ